MSGYDPSDRRDLRRDGTRSGFDRPDDDRPDDARSGDPRFGDARPDSARFDGVADGDARRGGPSDTVRRSPGAAPPRERMSADYDDDRAPRRPPRQAGDRRSLDVDTWTRRLVYAAAGIGAILLAAVGGWTLLSGHRGGIVVLGPPPGPVKVKPANPGGMELADSSGGETDMTGHGDARLAPGPEQPDPTALARQYGAPATPPAADPHALTPAASSGTGPVAGESGVSRPDAPASSSATPASGPASSSPQNAVPAEPHTVASPPATSPVAGSPNPDTPAPRAATPPAPTAPRPASRPDTGTDIAPEGASGTLAPGSTSRTTSSGGVSGNQGGTHMVQLAALDTEAQAHEEWTRLQHRAPDLLSGRTPVVLPVERAGRTLYRLRVSGFADMAASRAFCVKLRGEQVACTPAAF